MVFVVRNDLKMGKGKVAAQVRHWSDRRRMRGNQGTCLQGSVTGQFY